VGDAKKSDVSSEDDLQANLYDFGKLLLEIISGKLPYSEKNGDLLDWVSLRHTSEINLSPNSLKCNIVNINVCI